VIHLPVEEHVERDLIPRHTFMKSILRAIEDSAHHVLYTGRDLINARVGDSGIGLFDEGDILVGLIAAFVDIANEFIGL